MREAQGKGGSGSEREWELRVWTEPSMGTESVGIVGQRSSGSYEQCIRSPW